MVPLPAQLCLWYTCTLIQGYPAGDAAARATFCAGVEGCSLPLAFRWGHEVTPGDLCFFFCVYNPPAFVHIAFHGLLGWGQNYPTCSLLMWQVCAGGLGQAGLTRGILNASVLVHSTGPLILWACHFGRDFHAITFIPTISSIYRTPPPPPSDRLHKWTQIHMCAGLLCQLLVQLQWYPQLKFKWSN